MRSLQMKTCESIIARESYVGLRKAIEMLQEEVENRKSLALKLMNGYLDEREDEMRSDFFISKIGDPNCLHCSKEHQHYPSLWISLAFEEDVSLNVVITVDLNKKFANLTIGDLDDDVRNFLDDIDPLIDIFIEAFDKKL